MTPDFVTPSGLSSLAVAQQLEGTLVARAGADDAIEARHAFSVVIEHFRARFDDDADGFCVALKVGDEDFNAAAGGLAANFGDDHGEGARAAEIVVVAIDAGDHCVEQPSLATASATLRGSSKSMGSGGPWARRKSRSGACRGCRAS